MVPNRYFLAVGGIVVLFAVGLELFFLFSAGYGDGLEKTMERAGAEESPPIYEAPLGYGNNYATAFLAGLCGFSLLFLVAYGSGRLLGRKNAA